MTDRIDPARMSKESIAARTYLDGLRKNRPLSEPIIQGTIFSAESADSHASIFQSGLPTFYQRFGHPTSNAAAQKVAALEGAESALAFSSGMAAISTTLLTLLGTNDHVVVGKQIFDQTETMLTQLSKRYGVEVSRVNTTSVDAVREAIEPNTKLVYLETPSNPHLEISDISTIAAVCKNANIPLVVDSTFATPFGQSPIRLGASLVLHSGTKLLSGHMDVMCGFVVGEKNFVSKIQNMQKLLGGVLDPHAAWLALRGIKTLGLRSERIFRSAKAVATFLSSQPSVRNVRYPLHPAHPHFAVASKQMHGGGCVVVFSIRGGREAARVFLDGLKFIQIASSLGGVETVIELPYDLDWVEKARSAQQDGQEKIDLGHVRLSIGIEPAEEIIADLEQALTTLEKWRASSRRSPLNRHLPRRRAE